MNKSLAKTHKLIVQAYRDSALSYLQKAFKEGRINEPSTGRPSTSNTDDNLAHVCDLLNSDHQLSIQMIAETLNIPKTIAHELVTDKLDMRKVRAKLVPKLLTADQKNHRVTVMTELLKHPNPPTQRNATKISPKLNKSLAETNKLIVQAYGDSDLPYSQVPRWLKAFKEDREEVVDEPSTGQSSTNTTDDNLTRVHDLLNSDHQLSVRTIAETLNIPKTIVHKLVTDKLDIRKKNHRVTVTTELLKCVEIIPQFLDNVTTGDETCHFEYNPETSKLRVAGFGPIEATQVAVTRAPLKPTKTRTVHGRVAAKNPKLSILAELRFEEYGLFIATLL
ncbi:hypothetical protein J437_LFUL007586 [Ladona fulva]|uniref:Uncharacterized protein n=1 Tax=Ladona fulva TaxID=123851 RepID=A0A8K0K7A9_LADFU|nr:hypothetical protein J437_LFUL007586 [Ladona fulva]